MNQTQEERKQKRKALLDSDAFFKFKRFNLHNRFMDYSARIAYYVTYIRNLERAIEIYENALNQMRKDIVWDNHLDLDIRNTLDNGIAQQWADIEKSEPMITFRKV